MNTKLKFTICFLIALLTVILADSVLYPYTLLVAFGAGGGMGYYGVKIADEFFARRTP